MLDLILIVIVIILTVKGDYTFVWLFGGIFALALVIHVITAIRNKGKKPAGRAGTVRPGKVRYAGSGRRYAPDDEKEGYEVIRRRGTLIEHPHVIDDTDYECSVCGSRFEEPYSFCPDCGASFADHKEDYEEFDEEEDELEDWDEEDGW